MVQLGILCMSVAFVVLLLSIILYIVVKYILLFVIRVAH